MANSSNFNFIGNITIGSLAGQLSLEMLAPHYDAILLAYGASKDRTLGILGEDTLKGIYSARAFVGWYNGLPEYANLNPDLTQGEDATIIGQGNVALDVARILLQDPTVLRSTDITEHAVNVLQKSKVKRVRIVGRRGPLQVRSSSMKSYPCTKSLGCLYYQRNQRTYQTAICSIPSYRYSHDT